MQDLCSQENIYIDHHIQKAEQLYEDSLYVDAVREFILAINYIPSNDTMTTNYIDSCLLQNRDAIIVLIETKDEQKRIAWEKSQEAKNSAELAKRHSDKIERGSRLLFYNTQFAVAYNGKKYGFINKDYEIVIPFKFEEAKPFNSYGFSKVYYNNTDFLIATNRTEYILADGLSKLTTESEALDISGNGLVEIPAKVFEFQNLRILLCNGNHIQEIAPNIAWLDSLSHLFLHDNDLKYLPGEIGSLTRLVSLEAGNNKLITIPDSLVKLTNLTDLNLYDNNLFHLSNDIVQLKNLQYLDVSKNFLTGLPDSIVALSGLKTLIASNNMISSFPPGMHKMAGLEVLILNNNQLTRIPHELEKLKNLRILDLRGNPDLNPKDLDYLKQVLPSTCNIIIDKPRAKKLTPRIKK